MRLAADLHVHSIGSGHAYSTILEIAASASKKGLELVAITDHGPALPDGPHPYYFGNQQVIPGEIEGVRLLKGVEANIINEQGDLDLESYYLERLDIILAGFHSMCFPSNELEMCTNAFLKVLDNPLVDVIVHPGNPEYPIDSEAVIKKAAERGVAIELNNSSLCGSRKGSEKNCQEIARLIAQYGSMVSIGSDAHFAWDVGKHDKALEVAIKAGIKESQIVNLSAERVLKYLERKGHLLRRKPE